MTLVTPRQPGRDAELIPLDATPGPAARLSDLLHALLEIVRRRLLLLLVIAGLVFAVGVALIAQLTPRYESTARLRLDPSRAPTVSVANPGNALSDEAIDTEVTVLASPEVAREVIRRLDLGSDPEFRTDAASPNAAQTLLTQKVLGQLSVSRQKLTYVLNIAFRSRDAETAARVANGFAETYIQTRVGGSTSTAESRAIWYSQQLQKLEAEVRAADSRLAQYRASTGIVQGGANGTITDQQIAPLSGQLAEARSKAAETLANLAQAQRQVRAGGLDAVSDVRSSPVIADLRRQLAEVTRNLGEITPRYGEKHPETLKIRQQIAGLNKQILDEANRTLGSLRAEAAAAGARAASLEDAMRDLRQQQASNTRASVVADGLEREAAAKRAGYERVAQQRLEALQGASNNIANAELVDRAQVPLFPSAPNKRLLYLVALVCALGIAVGVVGAMELMAVGMTSLGEVERHLRVPLLASIPRVSVRTGVSPAAYLIDKPASMFAESLRNLRASLLGVGARQAPQVVAFTSAVPEEGKSTTALSFARTVAMTGTRTLLIDCDLRKAALGRIAGTQPDFGLVDVLRGERSASDAIVHDAQPALDLLLLPHPLFSAEDLFGGARMQQLLETLRARYPLIVLDLPPVMSVADARVVARLADAVAFIVRWRSTPSRAAASALAWLRGDGAQVAGAVFTNVDPGAEVIGGLFYSSKYASYYQRN